MSSDEREPRPSATGTYWIETWGCQMNVHDSEKIAGALEQRGLRRARGREGADVVLLNTCSIREKAAEKVFTELGRLRELKRDDGRRRVLGVCGCVAQQEGARIFERAPHVDLVVGPRATGSLPVLVENALAGGGDASRVVDTEYRDDSIRFPFDWTRREGAGTGKAFVTIIEGCNHRCTFCVVPKTRGREVSRDLEEVIAEVAALGESGIREVEFLGQTVNAYRDGKGRTLADLLLRAAEIDGVERIRFTTSHPAQMTDALMDAMAAASPKVAPYLHLPVQSGSSAVLRAMRRGYDREGYLRRVDGLRRRIPDLAFGSDVIVGFPTESERDFEETMRLLDEVEFDTLYSFVYSPRPDTAALALENSVVDETTAARRLAALQEKQRGIQLRRNRARVGSIGEILVEGPSKRDPSEWTGRTPDARIVNFPGETAPGRIERARIVDAGPYSLRGELLRPFA